MATETSNAVPKPAESTLAVERKSHGFRRKMVAAFIPQDEQDRRPRGRETLAVTRFTESTFAPAPASRRMTRERISYRRPVKFKNTARFSRDKRFLVVRARQKFVEE